MELMELNFKTEEGVEISFVAQERAVDCRVTFRDPNGNLEEESVFWLNAHEAKAVGQALMAVAEGSLVQGLKYE